MSPAKLLLLLWLGGMLAGLILVMWGEWSNRDAPDFWRILYKALLAVLFPTLLFAMVVLVTFLEMYL